MGHPSCYSDMHSSTAAMEQAGQVAEVGSDNTLTGHSGEGTVWGDGPAGAAFLQTVAAGMPGGVCPQQFMDSINTGSGQLGNRAFLHWVGELYAAGRGRETHAVAAQGLQYPGSPLTYHAPLQLMPKKKKRQEGSSAEGVSEGVSEATPEAPPGPGVQAEAQAPLPQEGLKETAKPGEKKKKKKSRVQVALNTLRAEGLDEFKCYIEANISERELLRTLTERISRAQDLGDRKDPALRAVEGSIGKPDPESVPAVPQAAVARPRQVVEKAVVAPKRTVLSHREEEFFRYVCRGDAGRLRRLLKLVKIDVNMADDYGVTPLCYAVNEGHTAVVRELLSIPGIDVNLGEYGRTTPLYIAVQEGRLDIMELLLAVHGINVNLAGADGTTALSYAAQRGQEKVVMRLLEVPDINVDARKDDGATPLFCAAQKGFRGVVELLIKRGADVNQPLYDGTPLLCVLVDTQNVEMIRFLLQAPGIQVNQTTRDLSTALAIASQRGHKEIVRLLLRKKADPNIALEIGTTPLHLACLFGHPPIVEMLLHAKADIDAEVAIGAEEIGIEEIIKCKPYDLAQLTGNRGIISLLERFRREKTGQSVQIERLSLADQPVRTFPPASAIASDSQDNDGMQSSVVAQTIVSPRPLSQTLPDSPPQAAITKSSLDMAKGELIQEVLRKLEQHNLGPLEGIRLLQSVNVAADIDVLCSLYNRLAGIERVNERTRRRRPVRGRVLVAGAEAAPPGFTLGDKLNLDADAVEGEIKAHLAPANHRFVSQTVNDMEFGRGKATKGYSDLLHASAGISGVGSCSVFFYIDTKQNLIRIVGIGHHLDRETYRLDYAIEELGGGGMILRLN